MVSLNGSREPEERLHAPQVKLPHQLPDDVVDGEGREVALKPLPSQLDLSLSAPFQRDDVGKLLANTDFPVLPP